MEQGVAAAGVTAGSDGAGAGKRVHARLGDRDLEALADLRRRWGLGDDSATLRMAVRRALLGEVAATTSGATGALGGATHAAAGATGEATRATARAGAGDARATRAATDPDGGAAGAAPGLPRGMWEVAEYAARVAEEPFAGREAELERVLEVLRKRRRNSVVLVGERGVGKSAMVRALARQIAGGGAAATGNGQAVGVGDGLSGDRMLVVLELGDVLREAGAAMARMEEVLAGDGRVVGEMDERDYDGLAAHGMVAEHFEMVKLAPMSAEETVVVLRSHRAALEAHHGVTIPDELLEVAAAFGGNVVLPRVLPGTAVDLLDEAASRQRRLSGQKLGWMADEGATNANEGGGPAVRLTRRTLAEVASRRSGHKLEQLLGE